MKLATPSRLSLHRTLWDACPRVHGITSALLAAARITTYPLARLITCSFFLRRSASHAICTVNSILMRRQTIGEAERALRLRAAGHQRRVRSPEGSQGAASAHPGDFPAQDASSSPVRLPLDCATAPTSATEKIFLFLPSWCKVKYILPPKNISTTSGSKNEKTSHTTPSLPTRPVFEGTNRSPPRPPGRHPGSRPSSRGYIFREGAGPAAVGGGGATALRRGRGRGGRGRRERGRTPGGAR